MVKLCHEIAQNDVVVPFFNGDVSSLGTFRDVSSFSCSDGLGRLACGWGDCVDIEVAFGLFRDAERELKINKGLFMVRSSQLH